MEEAQRKRETGKADIFNCAFNYNPTLGLRTGLTIFLQNWKEKAKESRLEYDIKSFNIKRMNDDGENAEQTLLQT